MSIQYVTFLPKSKAEQIQPGPTDAMISICDPGDEVQLASGWEQLLTLSFLDMVYDDDLLERFGEAAPRVYAGYPQRRHAEAIRQFVDELNQQNINRLYVHCYHGRSRSAAVASWVANRYGAELERNDTHDANPLLQTLLNNPGRYDRYFEPENTEEGVDTTKGGSGVVRWLKRFWEG